jgi:hypothetical protein
MCQCNFGGENKYIYSVTQFDQSIICEAVERYLEALAEEIAAGEWAI